LFSILRIRKKFEKLLAKKKESRTSIELNLVVSNKRKKEKNLDPEKGKGKIKSKKDPPPPEKNSSFLCVFFRLGAFGCGRNVGRS
jgi:hypothetical protein